MATAQADADNAAAPLGPLLVDVGAGPLRRWLPGRPGIEFIASLAGKPGKVGRRVSTTVGELDCVMLGRSAVEPKRGDQQIRFLAEDLIEAISPSNVLLVNPASAKAVIDTGGASIVRGARAFVRDMSSSPRVPRMVDSAVGVDNYVVAGAAGGATTSAGSPGAAVRRSRARPNSALPGWLRWPTRPAPIASRAEISPAKTGKDLVTMSETPITQQAEAAVTRINQLTERMLTAARNAGGDLADAHEKALRSLADNPADLKQPVEWVQALAEVHAKFIEEATDGLVKTASEAASDVPATGVLDEAAAQRIRGLNKQVLARASAAGAGAVDGYEKALQDMADFETKIAGSSRRDWPQAVARSHTKFVTDLVSMYANAIRNGLSG